jgi:flagellin
MRATLGAQHNRLTSALNNAQDHTLALKAAESRIFDADFASETASMTAHQIKLAAGASALAQAYGLSRNVIDLI